MGRIERHIKPLLRPFYHWGLCCLITALRRVRGDWQGMVWIDPLLVERTVNRGDRTLKRNDMWHFGRVCGGDWDLDGVPVKEYGLIYPILKQRIEGGAEYDAISEFRQNLRLIEEGGMPDNCRTEAQYRQKWIGIERLYWSIKAEGYRTQRQLKALRRLNEIRVQVGRNGDLLFEEGIHRLVIAQLLGLKSVPVIITRRHADWVARSETRQSKCMSLQGNPPAGGERR